MLGFDRLLAQQSSRAPEPPAAPPEERSSKRARGGGSGAMASQEAPDGGDEECPGEPPTTPAAGWRSRPPREPRVQTIPSMKDVPKESRTNGWGNVDARGERRQLLMELEGADGTLPLIIAGSIQGTRTNQSGYYLVAKSGYGWQARAHIDPQTPSSHQLRPHIPTPVPSLAVPRLPFALCTLCFVLCAQAKVTRQGTREPLWTSE